MTFNTEEGNPLLKYKNINNLVTVDINTFKENYHLKNKSFSEALQSHNEVYIKGKYIAVSYKFATEIGLLKILGIRERNDY